MHNLSAMLWVEGRKAIRSRMPLWTALGSLVMPGGIAFLIFVARNPDLSRRLGLVSAKANLLAYSATDWAAYLALFGQIMAGGGFMLFVIAISWVFGREFADGTLKDMLAVPIPRATILLAKFLVVATWSAGLALAMLGVSVAAGVMIGLPGGSPAALLQGARLVLSAACLTIVVVLPFAFLASVGRGYLLPMGAAVLLLLLTNLVAMAGWGEYFPWAVAGLYAQGKDPLPPISYVIAVLTGLAGMAATQLWWASADQHR
jgi:ABC-2 type transport system permease protein